MDMKASEQLLTAQQLAVQLGKSLGTIERYTREGKIPVIVEKGQPGYKLSAVLCALAWDVWNKPAGCSNKVTYQDYCQLPDDPGFRVEVFDGQIVKDPVPGDRHQHAVRCLNTILKEYFFSIDPEGMIYFAPMDVTLSQIHVVQPDWLYVASNHTHIVDEQRVNGAPDLVVEILSPDSVQKDRLLKMDIYCKAGIPHYWLVDPDKLTLEAYRRSGNKYLLVVMGSGDVVVTHSGFSGLEIPLAQLWP